MKLCDVLQNKRKMRGTRSELTGHHQTECCVCGWKLACAPCEISGHTNRNGVPANGGSVPAKFGDVPGSVPSNCGRAKLLPSLKKDSQTVLAHSFGHLLPRLRTSRHESIDDESSGCSLTTMRGTAFNCDQAGSKKKCTGAHHSMAIAMAASSPRRGTRKEADVGSVYIEAMACLR